MKTPCSFYIHLNVLNIIDHLEKRKINSSIKRKKSRSNQSLYGETLLNLKKPPFKTPDDKTFDATKKQAKKTK